MSKNIIFFSLFLTAAILAYFVNPFLFAIVETVTAERLPQDFVRLLQGSDLVTIAGYISIFGVLFFLLYLIFPVAYVWYHIGSARIALDDLPKAHDPVARTTKARFLAQFQGMGFIRTLADIYGTYLIQEPEQEITAPAETKTRLIKQNPVKVIDKKKMIAPVRATAPANIIFSYGSLVTEPLLLGFFALYARFLVGAGVIALGVSMMDYTLNPGQSNLLVALQPGLMALLCCVAAAIIIGGLTRLVDLTLASNTAALARRIDSLFHHNEWQRDLETVKTLFTGSRLSDDLKLMLQESLNQPMKEITSAVKALAGRQESTLNDILADTLLTFNKEMEKKSGAEMARLNESIKNAALSAERMKKQLNDASAHHTKQMNKQAESVSRYLKEMQETLQSGEATSHKEMEKMLHHFTTEVEKSYEQYGAFLESSLQRLEEKQAQIENAASNKDTILQDLHKTARDLGTISNASGTLLDRFNRLSAELEAMVTNIRERGVSGANGSAVKRDKLKSALMDLKQSSREKISDLPDM